MLKIMFPQHRFSLLNPTYKVLYLFNTKNDLKFLVDIYIKTILNRVYLVSPVSFHIKVGKPKHQQHTSALVLSATLLEVKTLHKLQKN